jgi:hypothetical protein
MERLPGEVGVLDAAHGALCDAGVGGAEAMDYRLEAETSYAEGAAEIGVEQSFGTGDPDSLEGMDRHAGGVAEKRVIESDGLVTNLIDTRHAMFDEGHPYGTHANVGQVFEGFKDVVGVRGIPLEEGQMDRGAIVAVDASGGAGGTVERRNGAGNEVGEGGECGGLWIVDCGF